MTNEIQVFQVFNFEGNNLVRVIERDGEIYFVAKDVAQALGYSSSSTPAQLMQSVPEIWKGIKRIDTPGGEQEMLCLTEQGLYFFLGRSDKPKALPYQMWIAGEVIPSIRKTGSYGIKSAIPSGAMEGAKFVFMSAGITENQLALALDKVYKSFVGRSALEAGEIVLKVPTKHQILTPTEIGSHFGFSGQRVNEILAGAGYQHKIAGKWEPLEPGEPFAVMLDTGKKHSSGVPVRQLKWDSSILDELKQLM